MLTRVNNNRISSRHDFRGGLNPDRKLWGMSASLLLYPNHIDVEVTTASR